FSCSLSHLFCVEVRISPLIRWPNLLCHYMVKHALSMAPELTTNVNEQNEQAVGFYKKVGFKVTGRSEVDDLGKPYPLLNLAYVGE
ncbi:GNAT family N-acetyltransferase, partial [Escherichia coli]|nr:GNAT family N-acetyltransferase [Escherichia coli]MDZ8362155.1 GNAT family N-acetyltransferase [Escherichia coli]MDZ8455957.1 GNAT family N-acetyltransferase [Escherichia coli]MDZ8586011.1 GNAT family N-acetyltransferase [Escherichia coli]MDZ8701241.1 GNAT family N-acetyltransferase [Escherichia coli]